MTSGATARRVLSLLVLVAGTAVATDQQLFGTRLVVRDPTGNQPRRVVVVEGKERHTAGVRWPARVQRELPDRLELSASHAGLVVHVPGT